MKWPLPFEKNEHRGQGWYLMLKRAVNVLGMAVRESGQALDRVGCRLQNNHIFKEKFSRHRSIMNIYNKYPDIAEDAFIAPSASVIGDVKIANASSIWYNCVLRGDLNGIRIGSFTNIQDRTVLITSKDNPHGLPASIVIGDFVTIGHGAIIQACTIERESLIGMGAIIGEGCHIETNAMIAAGSVVPNGVRIPSGELWAGNIAKFVRKLTPDEIAFLQRSAEEYVEVAHKHRDEFLPVGTNYMKVEELNAQK